VSKSDTPRTDAILPRGHWHDPEIRNLAVELVELSRQLERELAACQRRCAELEKDATTFRLIVERRLSCSIWDWRDGNTPEWVVIAKDLPRPVIRTYSELGIAVLECVKALDLTIALATQEPSK